MTAEEIPNYIGANREGIKVIINQYCDSAPKDLAGRNYPDVYLIRKGDFWAVGSPYQYFNKARELWGWHFIYMPELGIVLDLVLDKIVFVN